MNKNFLVYFGVLFLLSCATKTPRTDALLKHHSGLPQAFQIDSVPFIEQTENHCGPASLAMVLQTNRRVVDLKELATQMITPGKQGTFSTDLITTVKRQGMVPVKITDLKALLTEITFGQPVLVFQNLGFSWYPNWHYAVAVGYDLSGPDIILHSGKDKYLRSDMRLFERSWVLTNSWGLVVLEPGTLAATVDDLGHVAGISGLEELGKLSEAEVSYKAVLKKWSQSLPALIGIGNVLYAKKDFQGSVDQLRKATEFHPLSAAAWHNLATAQGAAGKLKAAKQSSLKALSLVEKKQISTYQESLKNWLGH